MLVRFVPPLTMLVMGALATSANAAGPVSSPWHADPHPATPSRFAVPDEPETARPTRPFGSTILAGRQLMSNAMVGFGLFGPKAEKDPLAPATARDLALPKARKAAIGFSLRF